MDYIESSCHLGIPLQQIEALLISNRARLFYSFRDKYLLLTRTHTSSPSSEFPKLSDQSVAFWRLSSSRHSIEACFLHTFWMHEKVYTHIMTQTTLSIDRPWLSLDHIFKSVSNIGLVRLVDNQWIKQYSGLFCILNAEGEVLSWKMTKTLSFNHTRDVLITLNEIEATRQSCA